MNNLREPSLLQTNTMTNHKATHEELAVDMMIGFLSETVSVLHHLLAQRRDDGLPQAVRAVLVFLVWCLVSKATSHWAFGLALVTCVLFQINPVTVLRHHGVYVDPPRLREVIRILTQPDDNGARRPEVEVRKDIELPASMKHVGSNQRVEDTEDLLGNAGSMTVNYIPDQITETGLRQDDCHGYTNQNQSAEVVSEELTPLQSIEKEVKLEDTHVFNPADEEIIAIYEEGANEDEEDTDLESAYQEPDTTSKHMVRRLHMVGLYDRRATVSVKTSSSMDETGPIYQDEELQDGAKLIELLGTGSCKNPVSYQLLFKRGRLQLTESNGDNRINYRHLKKYWSGPRALEHAYGIAAHVARVFKEARAIGVTPTCSYQYEYQVVNQGCADYGGWPDWDEVPTIKDHDSVFGRPQTAVITDTYQRPGSDDIEIRRRVGRIDILEQIPDEFEGSDGNLVAPYPTTTFALTNVGLQAAQALYDYQNDLEPYNPGRYRPFDPVPDWCRPRMNDAPAAYAQYDHTGCDYTQAFHTKGRPFTFEELRKHGIHNNIEASFKDVADVPEVDKSVSDSKPIRQQAVASVENHYDYDTENDAQRKKAEQDYAAMEDAAWANIMRTMNQNSGSSKNVKLASKEQQRVHQQQEADNHIVSSSDASPASIVPMERLRIRQSAAQRPWYDCDDPLIDSAHQRDEKSHTNKVLPGLDFDFGFGHEEGSSSGKDPATPPSLFGNHAQYQMSPNEVPHPTGYPKELWQFSPKRPVPVGIRFGRTWRDV